MKKSGVLCLFFTFNTIALFEYDRALMHANKGEWQEALGLLRTLVIDHPEDVQLMYDTGVASYNNQEYTQALAYFSEAMAASDKQDPLHEQSLFNRGNTHVQLNTLRKALDDYEAVLVLNPNNEKARVNRDIVRKMLQEQEQQQEKQKQDKQQEDQQQEQQENSSHSDEDQPSEGESKNEQENEGDSDENENHSGYDSQWDPEKAPEQKEESSPPSSQPESSDRSQQQSFTSEENNAYDGLEEWVASVLKAHDEKDSELNKQMIRATVHNQVADHDTCW